MWLCHPKFNLIWPPQNHRSAQKSAELGWPQPLDFPPSSPWGSLFRLPPRLLEWRGSCWTAERPRCILTGLCWWLVNDVNEDVAEILSSSVIINYVLNWPGVRVLVIYFNHDPRTSSDMECFVMFHHRGYKLMILYWWCIGLYWHCLDTRDNKGAFYEDHELIINWKWCLVLLFIVLQPLRVTPDFTRSRILYMDSKMPSSLVGTESSLAMAKCPWWCGYRFVTPVHTVSSLESSARTQIQADRELKKTREPHSTQNAIKDSLKAVTRIQKHSSWLKCWNTITHTHRNISWWYWQPTIVQP